MEREIICLSCPNGCHLHVSWNNRSDVIVAGGKCERGEPYAKEEVFEPKRVVTAVVPTTEPETPFLPVKTDKPVPIPFIPALLNLLYQQRVTLPVRLGDPLIKDFQKTGINVLFTRSAPE